ncbi:MAG: urease accessory protein UreH domain-containing protein [Bacillota bacterium]
MPGFLLGLSTGITCMAYCAPALFPYLAGGNRDLRGGSQATALFLGGRLGGYLFFAVLAWLVHELILKNIRFRSLLLGTAYSSLALTLFFFSFSRPGRCGGARHLRPQGPGLSFVPFLLGFFTGQNVCPPFLLAFAGAAGTGSLLGSLSFFTTFFLGTSVFFIPAPLLGALGRSPAARTIARMAAAVAGLYYACTGILALLGGIVNR